MNCTLRYMNGSCHVIKAFDMVCMHYCILLEFVFLSWYTCKHNAQYAYHINLCIAWPALIEHDWTGSWATPVPVSLLFQSTSESCYVSRYVFCSPQVGRPIPCKFAGPHLSLNLGQHRISRVPSHCIANVATILSSMTSWTARNWYHTKIHMSLPFQKSPWEEISWSYGEFLYIIPNKELKRLYCKDNWIYT